MEAYPAYYVAHNLPFVILFGLDTPESRHGGEADVDHPLLRNNSYSYKSELPSVDGPAAEALQQAFKDLDARDASWNSRPGLGKMGSVGFTCRSAGEELRLPPHKAASPSQSELEDLPSSWQLILHSPISPLTPASPLYPDGILSPAWMAKHQSLLPTAIICFYTFTIDATRSSLEDNALKTEINRLQAWFNETKYATRVVVVLVCDEAAHVSTVVERLGNIRRSTNLDTKTLLYMPGGLSVDESRAFVGSLLSNIHGTCIEYYRDLSKHARRKKNRGSTPQPTVPPTSGTSQVLSARGWNLRYEMKLGVFAEFRGEMDAAERNFEQAYEDLMDGDIFEGISNWSPRFNEARMLADVLAIRILRCLLWTNQTTAAAQSWTNHKYRMQELIDKKGKGTSTYGWQAWEAIWSTVMAEVIDKVQIPYFHVPNPTDEVPLVSANIYAPPERTISKDVNLSPWDHLHHQGYWYARSVDKLRSRRGLANSIPAEDRRAPGESPASTLASRSHIYDTYLCPEPHEEYLELVRAKGAHNQLILNTLEKAELQSETRHQLRAVAWLRLQIVQELATQGEWHQAFKIASAILKDSLWRREGWWHLLGEAYLLAYRCSEHIQDHEALIAIGWQLQSKYLEIADQKRPSLQSTMNGLSLDDRLQVHLDFETTVPCLSVSFTFGTEDACVGDPLQAQLTIEPYISLNSEPVILSHIIVKFKGSVSSVRLNHRPAAAQDEDVEHSLREVQLEQDPSENSSEDKAISLSGAADLAIRPGQPCTYHFSVIPRESQELCAVSVDMTVEKESFVIDLSSRIQEPVSRLLWWERKEGSVRKRFLDLHHNCQIEVKPRPPKLQIELPNLRETYYTDETTNLTVSILNEEEEAADVRLKVHVFHGGVNAEVKWADNKDGHTLISEAGSTLPQRDLGLIEASDSTEATVVVEKFAEMCKISFEIEAVYTLRNDPNTIITKSISQELSFVRPFEANYEASLGVHPDPWPSFFGLQDKGGLVQRSYVTAKIMPYTTDPVYIEEIELRQTEPYEENVSCTVKSDKPENGEPVLLNPHDLRSCIFTIDAQKHELEDRRPCAIRFNLVVNWRRQASGDGSGVFSTNTTILPASTISMDFSKPRALAAAYLSGAAMDSNATVAMPIVHVTYTIENPSDYMLQFNVIMEATEQFAFSGPKMTTLQLTPFSQSQTKFTLLPFERGTWISPVVRITDIGFGEVLRVHAGEGIRSEKGRCMVWIPDEV